MDSKILFIAVFLSAVIGSDSRIIGRKLRNGEPCHTPGFFGDAEDCRKFYRCAEHPTEDENNPHLIRYAFRCPNGTVYDEALTTCNHPDAVMNKPANCQIYDPEEPMSGNYKGVNAAVGTGGIWNNFLTVANPQLQQQTSSVLVPVNQYLYPTLTLPYGNLIQYG